MKRDADRFQAAKQAEFDKGSRRDTPGAITLGEFCRKYMARRTHEWREKTRLQIQDLCRRLVDHSGSGSDLSTISPDQASRFWSQARKVRAGFEGQALSRYTRNRLLRDAKTMFKYAVDWSYLAVNPFAVIKSVRTGKRNHRKWHYVKPAEYMGLLRAAPDLRWKVLYALAYTSGARFGELFNLTEDNIDFERGRLLIQEREATPDLPPFQVKDHEDREIPLPRHTLKLLAGWLQWRSEGSPLILLNPDRFDRVQHRWQSHHAADKAWLNAYMVNNVLRDIRTHARWAGLKLDGVLTLHCFRKSCGQNWADHLPMNVVKELMGHASIATTAEFYSTVSEEHEAKAQWVIEAITTGRARREPDAEVTPGPVLGLDRRVG
ncbi:MAG: site-specific integrase [bacterium]|nr:site-specific integrase [bacterium]